MKWENKLSAASGRDDVMEDTEMQLADWSARAWQHMGRFYDLITVAIQKWTYLLAEWRNNSTGHNIVLGKIEEIRPYKSSKMKFLIFQLQSW